MDDDLKAAIARVERAAKGSVLQREIAEPPVLAADLRTLLSALRQRDEALDWLAGRTNLELDYSYGDEDEEGRGWRIHRVSGNRSDREWELIATAETPAKAIEQARAILTGSETK